MEIIPYSDSLWETVKHIWCDLAAKRPDVSAFMSPLWIQSWISVYGSALQPNSLIWRTSDKTAVGICLLTIRRERRGPFRVSNAYLNATGEHEIASEHNILLCEPAFEARISRELVQHLLCTKKINTLVLNGFRPESVAHMNNAFPVNRLLDGYVSEDRYVSLKDLRDTQSTFLSHLSRSTRDQIKRSARHYERLYGNPTFEVAKDAPQATEWLSSLKELHNQRWSAKSQHGAFHSTSSNRFHSSIILQGNLADHTSELLTVNLARLRFGVTTVGVLLNYLHRGVVNFYQSGFQYESDNRLKPGLVTHAFAIEHYLARELREYDFLGGTDRPVRYKVSLANGSRPLHWSRFSLPSLKIRTINGLIGIKRKLAATH